MFTLRKIKDRGFTIVELLIVIVVIGILATLVITTYTGIQQKARDTKRKTDVNAIQGHLESYYTESGKYPTLANVNDATFRAANMKGLDANALKDPKGTSQALCGTTTSSCYGYVVTPTDCDNSTTDCTGYTLTATLEAGGTYSKTNL